MFTLSPFPERLTVEMTNECNYQCLMCPSRHRPDYPRGYMAPALFRRIVDEAAEHLPVALVPFFRGESLLHPQVAELLGMAKVAGLGPVQLSTNGSLITADLAGRLLDSGLDFISFSLDTVRPDEYAEIRKGGNLARVLLGMETFLEIRERGGYGTTVQVSATRTAFNHDSLEELIDQWRSVADRVRVYYEHSADGHTGSLDDPDVPDDMIRRACRKVFKDMVVYYNGGVAACNHDWFREPPLGDLSKQSIGEVWLGEAYKDLRGQHTDPATLIDTTCLHCDHWKIDYLDPPFIGELYTRDEPAEVAAG